MPHPCPKREDFQMQHFESSLVLAKKTERILLGFDAVNQLLCCSTRDVRKGQLLLREFSNAANRVVFSAVKKRNYFYLSLMQLKNFCVV